VRTKKSRYQQGSIRRVKRAKGYAWEVRYSEMKDGKRYQRTEVYDGALYKTEKDVRKAIELTVSQINAGTGGERADAKFGAITAIYRKEHLPTLQHSSQESSKYLLRDYIEAEFGKTPIREMHAGEVNTWLQALKLSASSKRNIRTVLSVCFRLAALHRFIPEMAANPMLLIKIKGVSKRKKKIVSLTVADFKRLLAALPEPLNIMVLLLGAYGLRISELLALKWEDMNEDAKTISIVRKFTHGKLGNTKTDASEAPMPLAQPVLNVLREYRPRTGGSEWLFPSPRNGRPRSQSMLLTKGLKPVARDLGLGNVGFHTLRHACRSWLSSLGAAMGTQKSLLRHANISTTMDVYGSALTEDMRRANTDLVNQLMG
jgi:integrase